MLKEDRRFAYAAVIAAIVFGAGLLFSSADGAQPQSSGSQHQPSVDRPKQSRSLSVWVATVDDPIALYTAIVATFTIVLAAASIWQGRLTRRSIELANREFISTHRPKVRVRALELAIPLRDGEKAEVMFRSVNTGDTSATVTQIEGAIFILSAHKGYPSYANFTHRVDYDIRIEPGRQELFSVVGRGLAIGESRNVEDFPNDWRLYCVGIVHYRDDNGTVRETGFCRYWHVKLQQWLECSGAETEYAY